MLIVPMSVVILIIAFVFSLYKKDALVQSEIKKAQNDILFNLNQKLDKKFDVGLTNAVSLTTNLDLIEALRQQDRQKAASVLKSIGEHYKNNTNFKGIRVHIHDKNLKSFLRSWNIEKYGDDLSFRDTIQTVQQTKKAQVIYELGSSGLYIRGIVPIIHNNELLGSLEFMQGTGSVSRDFEKEDKRYIMLLTPKALEIAKNAINNIKVDKFVVLNDKYFSKQTLEFAQSIDYDKLLKDGLYIGKEYFSTFNPIKNAKGEIIAYDIVGQPTTFIEQKIQNLNGLIYTFIGIIVLIVILINLVVSYGMKKIILDPLDSLHKGIESFFNFINRKTNNVEVIEVSAKDEIGDMVEAINMNIEHTKQTFISNSQVIQNTTEVVNSIKNGLLTHRISQSTSDQELEKLRLLINEMLEELNKNIGKDINQILKLLDQFSNDDYTSKIDDPNGKIEIAIMDVRNTINTMLVNNKRLGLILLQNADELAKSVDSLYTASNKEAATLEETAAIITDIANNLQNTAQNANEMLRLANESKESADIGKQLSQQTLRAMDDINDKVNTIHEAISVIDQIAFQTNILSLNAAVEAATAGEAGKGFAVVAQEVRNLASRSAEAAKEISSIVEAATQKANEGKDITHKMSQSFETLNEKIVRTTQLVQDVTQTSNSQLNVIKQLDEDMNSIDSSSQANASVAGIANQIAIETKEIASSVVKKTEERNFEGKNSVEIRKSIRDEEFNGKEKRRIMKAEPLVKEKQVEVKQIKPTTFQKETQHKKPELKAQVSASSDDEWESF